MADADQMTDMNGLIDAGDLDALTDKMRPPAETPKAPELHIAGGHPDSWIEPIAKWRDMTNFVVPYVDTSNPWKDVERQRPIFVDAMEKAGQWFGERGGPTPMTITDEQIEVRLYPKTKQIVFFVKGYLPRSGADGVMERKECGVPYMLTRGQVGWLKATNRWPTERPKDEALH